MRKKIAIAALLLAALLAFTGCSLLGGLPAESLSEPESLPQSTAESTGGLVIISGETEPASLPEAEEDPPADDYPGMTGGEPALPEGPYQNFEPGQEGQLAGSWFNFPYGRGNAEGDEVLQIRVGEPNPNSLMVSRGLAQTDAGFFYWGEFTLGEGGRITATLEQSVMSEEPVEFPPVHLELLAQHAGNPGELLVFTLLSYETDDTDFNVFDDYMGMRIPYFQPVW